MYKLIKNLNGDINIVLRIVDNAFIPFDPNNTDAIEFCKWLKDGGIPESADGGTTPTQEEINAIIAKLS
jgi:hypothetical protein